MRLKNKKTGEIIDVYKGRFLIHYNNGRNTKLIKSLDELKEWEDYEEKDYFFIDSHDCAAEWADGRNKELANARKEVVNYYETIEECRKAVEKLKAWKRLKDKGFKFTDFARVNNYTSIIRATFDESWSNIYDDLDLIFGGEE